MDKKGALFHLILFGVLIALGVFFLSSVNANDQRVNLKGPLQISFLWTFQEAEKGLLLMDQTISNVIAESKEAVFQRDYAVEDLGCGLLEVSSDVEPLALLNDKDTFCSPKLRDLFLEIFNDKFEGKNITVYREIKLWNEDLIGIAEGNKVLRQIPGGIAARNGVLVYPPFLRKYEYNPSFRLPLGTDFSEFTLGGDSRDLVDACRGSTDLEPCVIKYLPNSNWRAQSDCADGEYSEVDEKVVFCFSGEGNVGYSFALDFSHLPEQ